MRPPASSLAHCRTHGRVRSTRIIYWRPLALVGRLGKNQPVRPLPRQPWREVLLRVTRRHSPEARRSGPGLWRADPRRGGLSVAPTSAPLAEAPDPGLRRARCRKRPQGRWEGRLPNGSVSAAARSSTEWRLPSATSKKTCRRSLPPFTPIGARAHARVRERASRKSAAAGMGGHSQLRGSCEIRISRSYSCAVLGAEETDHGYCSNAW